MNVVEETKKLNLPLGEYAVFGSGLLGALGIRESVDLDLFVSARLFDELQKRGWEWSEVSFDGRMSERLSLDKAEAFKAFWYGGKDIDVEALIAGAEVIDGVAFLPLAEVVKIKRALNRPKDCIDIALINAYLAERHQS